MKFILRQRIKESSTKSYPPTLFNNLQPKQNEMQALTYINKVLKTNLFSKSKVNFLTNCLLCAKPLKTKKKNYEDLGGLKPAKTSQLRTGS